MKVFCAHDKMVVTDTLKPNPKNPNKHPENQIDLLAKIIKHNGWRAPITVSTRSGFIVKGHGRLEAAKALECETVPVDFQDYETDADEIADLLADNKIQELSEIDTEIELFHKQELIEADFDLELAGFCSLTLDDYEKDVSNKESFEDISDNIKTDKVCPKCGYEWS